MSKRIQTMLVDELPVWRMAEITSAQSCAAILGAAHFSKPDETKI